MNKKAIVKAVLEQMARVSASRQGHQRAILQEISTPGVIDAIADGLDDGLFQKRRGRKKLEEQGNMEDS